MKNTLLALAALAASASTQAQDYSGCGDLQPSLHAYRAQELGRPLRPSDAYAKIRDGDGCEKWRRDLKVHACRAGAARRVVKKYEPLVKYGPAYIRKAIEADARRVGGPAAKAQAIKRSQETYAKDQIRLARARAELAIHEAAYRTTHAMQQKYYPLPPAEQYRRVQAGEPVPSRPDGACFTPYPMGKNPLLGYK